MKYPFTGLYHYCFNLGKSLVTEVDKNKMDLSFYLSKKNRGIFGADQQYLKQSFFHKLSMPSLKGYAVWHATHHETAYLPIKSKLPILLTVHDLNFIHDNEKSTEKKGRYLRDLKNKIDCADHIVAISKFTLSELNHYIDLKNKPISVIYNGCNIIVPITQIMRPLAAPSTSFLFTIGTIAVKKNFHVLPSLLVGNQKKLIIAGIVQDADYKRKIIQEAVKWKVINRVFFTGPISENDKQWYYQNCEAFVFPSLAEGFGLPVLEALYFKKPVFLSEYGSLPEVGGNAAYYFKDFEFNHMRTVMEDGLKHYENDLSQSEKAYERAICFDWNLTAKQYLALYETLI